MLHGGKDRLVPSANVDYLEAALRTDGRGALFTKVILPNANHFIPWQQPTALREAILRLKMPEPDQNLASLRAKQIEKVIDPGQAKPSPVSQ